MDARERVELRVKIRYRIGLAVDDPHDEDLQGFTFDFLDFFDCGGPDRAHPAEG